jgi:hypothetical protein
VALLGAVAVGVFCSAVQAVTIRAYHIGNSVTDTLRYNGVTKLAQQDRNVYTFGKHMSPGTTLSRIWNSTSSTSQQYSVSPFGTYRNALRNYTWDAVTLQPFDSALLGSSGDLQMVKNFINYTTPRSPNAQFYIYQRWARKTRNSSGQLSIDYQKKWVQTHNYDTTTAGTSYANETRGYFERLLNRANAEKPSALRKKLLMVPVGDVMFEIDKRMRAGRVPGYNNVGQLYTDHIHLNPAGSYLVGLTFYSTMYRDNPIDSAVPANWNEARLTATQRRQFQEAVWQVVSNHKYSGVKIGDTSRDGMLGMEDVEVIRGRFNTPGLTVGQGDANLDGKIDLADFSLVAASYNLEASGGASGANTTSAVPEPSVLASLALFGIAIARRRR